MSMEKKFLSRAAELTGAYGNYRTAPDLVYAETIAAARCKLVYSEMELFTNFCYQMDSKGRYLHLAGGSQISPGVWTPWGGSGKSALTRLERDVVRCWLLSLNNGRPPLPVFFYIAQSRRWYVDTMRYESVQDALAWLNRHQLTPKTWLNVQMSM
jgi:hypothetical protein